MKDFKKKGREAGRVDRKLTKKYTLYMKRCPNCHVLVGVTAKECWRCGAPL